MNFKSTYFLAKLSEKYSCIQEDINNIVCSCLSIIWTSFELCSVLAVYDRESHCSESIQFACEAVPGDHWQRAELLLDA